MKNFIFISPNFPAIYWKFCEELKNNGLRVLGIGDAPYAELKPELKNALTDYYKVSSLADYDEMFRAVAFLTYKYGKIDYLESNNEFWLMQDAALRTEFHITSGFMNEDMERIKLKSVMKEFYAKAGLPTARFHLVKGYDDAAEFAHMVGYPVVVKPDNGVGASNTYRLKCDDDLHFFIDHMDDNIYIMEEFVKGHVETYDAIINADGQPVFESGNVTPWSLMDVVNENKDSIYYIVKELSPQIREAGLKTVEAFGVRSRFVHLEFFVLDEDQDGLGSRGDVLGLEVNMRPAGGFTPDMYDYAYDTDVYKIWADMIAFNESSKPAYQSRHYCAFVGRRDGKQYAMDHDAVMAKYGSRMKLQGRIPDALSGAMANQMYVANMDTKEELDEFYRDLLS